jgi:hypothetical protein
MSVEAILLAIVSAARPTGVAAVYALLGSPEPRRVLTAYILVGFTWSVGVGVLIVSAFGGITVETGTVTDVIDVLGGVAALGFAVGLATGRLWSPNQGSGGGESRLVASLRNPSLRVAAAAGVLTHLPGLFYLLGLNLIVATDPSLVEGTIDVAVFNVLWFSTPVASLVFSVRRPLQTRATLARVNDWGRRHQRAGIIVASFLVGVYFTLRGALDLLG